MMTGSGPTFWLSNIRCFHSRCMITGFCKQCWVPIGEALVSCMQWRYLKFLVCALENLNRDRHALRFQSICESKTSPMETQHRMQCHCVLYTDSGIIKSDPICKCTPRKYRLECMDTGYISLTFFYNVHACKFTVTASTHDGVLLVLDVLCSVTV